MQFELRAATGHARIVTNEVTLQRSRDHRGVACVRACGELSSLRLVEDRSGVDVVRHLNATDVVSYDVRRLDIHVKRP